MLAWENRTRLADLSSVTKLGGAVALGVRTDHVPLRYWMTLETGLPSGRPNHRAFDYDSGAHIFPERDQQLSRHRHDRRFAPTTAVAFDSVLEPVGECRARLMAYPKPG